MVPDYISPKIYLKINKDILCTNINLDIFYETIASYYFQFECYNKVFIFISVK